jgi:hypothetical protein
MNTKKDAIILFCDASSGRYIPQRFAAEIMPQYLQGVTQDQLNELADPDNRWYWDTWNTVLDNARVVDGDTVYQLHHDGDLWLYCWELMTDEEKTNFSGDDWE